MDVGPGELSISGYDIWVIWNAKSLDWPTPLRIAVNPTDALIFLGVLIFLGLSF